MANTSDPRFTKTERLMDLCDANDIKTLLARHGFRFSKSMGQNFLVADWAPRDIAASCALTPGDGVLEVGPGVGVLTRELSARAGKVVAVELDRALLPLLTETLAGRSNVEVVSGDILKTDIPALVRDKLAGLEAVACANLPYNITTPALTALLNAKCFRTVTVMLQREAAQRVCASPAAEGYGVFSIFCQYRADIEVLFDVPPECFLPAPKVTSRVLRLTPKAPPPEVTDEDFFFRVVRGAFALRRKTLANSLSSALSVSRAEVAAVLADCGLPETVRGEALSIGDFVRLSERLRR